MSKRKYRLRRVRDDKVVTKSLDESWVFENQDVLRQLEIDGELYQRCTGDEFAEVEGVDGKPLRTRARWPYWSEFAGVAQPGQIAATRDMIRKKTGYTVEFNAEGDIKLESPKQRREVLRALGLYDRNAGYGDPVPNENLRRDLGIGAEPRGFA